MTETTWRRVTGWAIGLAGVLAVVVLLERLRWLVTPVVNTLTPFVIAFLIAFLVNPVLTWLEKKRLSRVFSLVVTCLLFLMLFAGAVLLWVPKLVEQGADLASSMPDYVRSASRGLNNLLHWAEPVLRRVHLPTTLPGLMGQFGDQIKNFSSSALSAMSGFVMDAVGKATWLVIIPLVTIWLLMNWKSQSDRFQALLPDPHRDRIMHTLQAIGRVLNSYVRGTLILALLYGVTTALVLGLALRMPYAMVLGLVPGLVSPIPYIGTLVILLTTGVVAYATHPSFAYIGGVLAAMIVQNNVLFDNIVAPRVLGGSVGLSLPLSIFALMLGGSLFGIAGMILAVPVGAAIKVTLMEFFPKLRDGEPDAEQADSRRSESKAR